MGCLFSRHGSSAVRGCARGRAAAAMLEEALFLSTDSMQADATTRASARQMASQSQGTPSENCGASPVRRCQLEGLRMPSRAPRAHVCSICVQKHGGEVGVTTWEEKM